MISVTDSSYRATMCSLLWLVLKRMNFGGRAYRCGVLASIKNTIAGHCNNLGLTLAITILQVKIKGCIMEGYKMPTWGR